MGKVPTKLLNERSSCVRKVKFPREELIWPSKFQLQTTPGVASVASAEERGPELYGCFSSRVGDNSSSLSSVLPATEGEAIAVLEAPVLQAMPELRKLCLSSASPLSMEHLEMDSSATSCEGHVSPLSCEQLEVPQSIVSVVHVVDDVVSVVPLVEDVDAAGVLVPAPRNLLVDDN